MGHFYHLAPWQSLHSVNKLQRGQISWLNIDDERRKTRDPTGAKSTHQRVIKQSHKKTYGNFFIYFWLIITILSRSFFKLDIDIVSFWLFWSEPNLDCYWCHDRKQKKSHRSLLQCILAWVNKRPLTFLRFKSSFRFPSLFACVHHKKFKTEQTGAESFDRTFNLISFPKVLTQLPI